MDRKILAGALITYLLLTLSTTGAYILEVKGYRLGANLSVSTNEPPTLLQSSKIIVKPEDTKVGDKIGVITARDKDGPRELEFFVQSGGKLVNLSKPTGSSKTGRAVNILLATPLDRDWVILSLFSFFVFFLLLFFQHLCFYAIFFCLFCFFFLLL
ncbi:uncharacterized protein LOC106869634 [Octopus bimaculoides]|uniref:uncharacterized protein LOC106869634 n=1 Tax=Octopus bimaculoides TaxID=37653 RepID=UPI0022E766BE|nr:uncharacterized protein LOC106869634 [Octopus bimaculoides]XP_052831815.1 uncharacterized protein LOC106869634 [Octopus bimaculoides]